MNITLLSLKIRKNCDLAVIPNLLPVDILNIIVLKMVFWISFESYKKYQFVVDIVVENKSSYELEYFSSETWIGKPVASITNAFSNIGWRKFIIPLQSTAILMYRVNEEYLGKPLGPRNNLGKINKKITWKLKTRFSHWAHFFKRIL